MSERLRTVVVGMAHRTWPQTRIQYIEGDKYVEDDKGDELDRRRGRRMLAATRVRFAADYGFGASGQRPYQSNGCGLRLTTTFLIWV